MQTLFRIFALLAAAFGLAAGAFMLDRVQRYDLVLPRTYLGDLSLGGISRSAARDILKKRIEVFLQSPFQIAARGQIQTVTLKELGVFINDSILMAQLPFSRGFSASETAFWSIVGQRIYPKVTVERTEMLRVISQKFPDIPKAKNASLIRDGNNIVVQEAKSGLSPQLDKLISQVEQNIDFFEHRPLFVEFRESDPEVFTADLELFKSRLIQLLPAALKLISGKETWTVDFTKHPEWLVFERKKYTVADGEFPFVIQWDSLSFAEFTDRFLAEKLEQAPDDVRISRNDAGTVQFEGFGNEGRAIQRERLLTLANIAIRDNVAEVEIPTEMVTPKVEVSADLASLGIQELLSVGHTKFAGSPANRQHNIGVGIKHFNGLLIPPGATFSFGENLGVVDGSTGYRKELVIKPEGTIPEYGGGICQVSSTLYRAALFAGLPIAQRKPHSYVVSYYAQVGGHGLDATVYPPAVDLKFINDTPGYIAIQSYVDGINAYFKLYGSSDGRKVEMQGPIISNRRAAPTEPVYVPDPKLPTGEKKQVEKAHPGFDTLWSRIISRPNQAPITEKIASRYKAVPDKFLVGGETPPDTAKKDFAEEVNPYE